LICNDDELYIRPVMDRVNFDFMVTSIKNKTKKTKKRERKRLQWSCKSK